MTALEIYIQKYKLDNKLPEDGVYLLSKDAIFRITDRTSRRMLRRGREEPIYTMGNPNPVSYATGVYTDPDYTIIEELTIEELQLFRGHKVWVPMVIRARTIVPTYNMEMEVVDCKQSLDSKMDLHCEVHLKIAILDQIHRRQLYEDICMRYEQPCT